MEGIEASPPPEATSGATEEKLSLEAGINLV